MLLHVLDVNGLSLLWFRLFVCWVVGLFVGLQVCWFVALLVYWFIGLLVCLLVGWLARFFVCSFVVLDSTFFRHRHDSRRDRSIDSTDGPD